MSDTFIYWVAWGIPISHGVVFWVSLIIGLSDISKIQRDPSGIYCHIVDNKVPCVLYRPRTYVWLNSDVSGRTLLTGTLVILFLGSMLIMEVFTIVHLVQQRATVRATMRVRGSDFPLPLFIRTVLYTISGGFGIIMVDILLNVSSAMTVNLLAIIPLSVALVFGTQKELLRAFFLCQFGRNKTGVVPLSATNSV
ncbi:hypothetical protein B0H14DRAFT_1221049 [Mycena olivaceomarginata]|nr:hypothetical protein B0H14DRAFT_1221049 [Mycena olivaceomarginata]